MLVGRDDELTALTDLVEAARHGTAGCVVLRGEPGLGKSALLDALVDAVRGDADGTVGATVLRAQGLEVESPMAFAALHRLLRPVMRQRDQLPDPQARALRVAFGEEDGPGVEPLLVGIATLSLLTAAAEETLVVCVVDDAHWLDPASAQAMLFCARRIGADRVAMVLAARPVAETLFEAQGLAELTLAGLGPDAARTLLDHQVSGAPAGDVTDRLVTATGGNPLALLELSSELSDAQLQGDEPLPERLHLTARLEEAFLDRTRRLPADARTLLLLVAADDTGVLTVIEDAAQELDLAPDAFEVASASGLLRSDAETVTLRHPLVRSAVYQAADPVERRRTHASLAAAYARAGDPDREAWQRAAAATGPDAEVAAALRRVADHAQRRGAHAAAMAAYERAAALTADVDERAATMFAAGRAAWAAGRAAEAQHLLREARTTSDPVLLADVDRLRGHIEVNVGSAVAAHGILVEAARSVHDLDPPRALETAVAAAVMRTYGADSGARLSSDEVPVEVGPGDVPRTVCLKHLLDSMTRASDDDLAGAVAALDEALAVGEDVDERDVLWNLGNAALQLGDDAGQRRFYGLALARAREAGAVTAVVYALERQCFGHYLSGELGRLRSDADEARSLASSIGQVGLTALPTAWLAVLAALQGRDDHDALLAEVDEVAAAHPLGILADPVHDLTRWARGLRAAASGDHAGAVHHLSRLRLAALSRMAGVDRVEAAVRADETDLAGRWVAELAAFAEATGRPWALATTAYGRALTAEDASAEAHFLDALEHHGRAGRPLDQARTRLAYGEWLRRTQRRVDARVQLRRALEACQDAHATPWVDRATRELRASGETARKRDPSTATPAHPDGAQDRAAGQHRAVEQGRGGGVLGVAAHGRVPPAQRLHQGRHHLPRRARAPRPRLSDPTRHNPVI